MSTPPAAEALRSLELATEIARACAAAGITDPVEIPALIAYARSAEAFSTALTAYQRAQHAWNHFIATHGADDPGQDYHAAQVTSAREVYDVAQRDHAVALLTWRAARGLESLRALAA